MVEKKIKLLEKIKSPDDLKKLSVNELTHLAAELRERILSVVSATGGHLAPSLGAVELTIALHYVYHAPADKIIWDVGHQCYAHKILTGRDKQFPTIRQQGGLSGFPRSCEGPYDAFDTGHASTSISVGLGFAQAGELKHENYHVVSVIGDGSMTGGLAFEGLNNAGVLNRNITVVLNDNKMSISPNVGALSSYLSRILCDPMYNKLKRDVWELTGRLKGLGFGIRNIVHRIDESMKTLLMPGKLFEELGFRYFGPLNGHNIKEMVGLFKNIRENVTGPVLIHVITKKGKGYEYAEKDAPKFHGIGSFEKSTGKASKKAGPPTYSSIFGRTLVKMAQKDNKIVGITAAMPSGTGIDLFAEKYPDRYFDVGIAEAHAVTFAGSLAKCGIKPVVAIYSTFLQRAFDQIIHDVALQQLNVLFCLDRGGLAADDGPTHHGAFDMAYLRCIPNAVIAAPKDENEMQHMMWTGLNHPGPVFIRYPRGVALGVKMDKEFKRLPVSEIDICEKGKDVLILAVGEMVHRARLVREKLLKKGITPTLINARFIKPLPSKKLALILKSHPHVFTLEAGTVVGGFGTAVLELLNSQGVSPKVFIPIGFPDEFIQHGDKETLYKDMGLSIEKICKKIASSIT